LDFVHSIGINGFHNWPGFAGTFLGSAVWPSLVAAILSLTKKKGERLLSFSRWLCLFILVIPWLLQSMLHRR